jgi:probable rRNA maturation factor
MISIKNRQKKIVISTQKLHNNILKILKSLKYQDFDLGILLTTNKTIRKLNKTFRGKDRPTDILSFPFHANLKAGQKIIVKSPEDKNLGDIIISLEFAQKDASTTWNRKLDEHLTALLAHGIAHLIGYDHITDQDFNKMVKIEKKLLKFVGIKY